MILAAPKQVYLVPILIGDPQLANGLPSTGGTIYAYYSNSNTLCNTYTTVDGITNNPNPILLGSQGHLPTQIWIPGGQYTDFFIYNSSNVLVDSQLSVLGNGDPSNFTDNSNLALFVANTAYSLASLATKTSSSAKTIGNVAYQYANAAANTVMVSENGTLVLANANVNFNNSTTVNVTVVANGTSKVDVAYSLNLTAMGLENFGSSNTANGFAYLASNVIMNWGKVFIPSNPPGPISVNFNLPFKSSCWSVAVSMDGDGTSGDNVFMPRVYNPGPTTFTLYFDVWNDDKELPAGGANVYFLAIGT